MNPVFYCPIFLFVAVVGSSHAQIQRSDFAELLSESEEFLFNKRSQRQLQYEFWQPLGVPNLFAAHLLGQFSTHTSAFRLGYTLESVPGLRHHMINWRFGRRISKRFAAFQEMGFGVLESSGLYPPSLTIDVRHILSLQLNQTSSLVADLDNWVSLIWTESKYLRPCYLSFTLIQQFEKAKVFLKYSSHAVGSRSLCLGAFYAFKNNQGIFLGVGVLPFSMGLGYEMSVGSFHFRVLLEQSPIFGSSPYSWLSWNY